MAVDATKVRVGITGAVSRGLTSATAPTGTAAALTGFTDLGGISEDGVTLTVPGNGSRTPIKVWQNGATVRSVYTSSDDVPQLQFVLLETKKEVIETFFGVTATSSSTEGTFDFVVQNRTASSYVLDVVDGSELARYYVPQGVVAEVGDLVYTNGEAVGYDVTLDCNLDAVKGYNFRSWLTALKS